MQSTREGSRVPQFHHARRATSSVARWALVGALTAAGLGCSGATGSEGVDDEIIIAQLQARGFDVSTLEFLDDQVIVEGDIALSRTSLLGPGAFLPEGGVTSDTIDKGYFRREVRFGGGFIAVSLPDGLDPDWSAALLAAADQWNDACPAFRERAGTPRFINIELGDLGVGTNSTIARATPPPDEPKITLNARYSSRCATAINLLTPEEKAYTALHEMGHVLGFEHQPPAAQNPGTREVPGTSTGSDYETVMATGGCRALTELTEDDLRSAAVVYPSRQVDPNCLPQCEENCLSLLTPGAIGLCQFSCPEQCR